MMNYGKSVGRSSNSIWTFLGLLEKDPFPSLAWNFGNIYRLTEVSMTQLHNSMGEIR